ncbi:MAG TPA: trypsin-like peptidase domain-containing protein [Planctomycetaceae bacterium]|nr:trypsin-like peptidase domain-containing protein [Planctomycetaceae bacterium]
MSARRCYLGMAPLCVWACCVTFVCPALAQTPADQPAARTSQSQGDEGLDRTLAKVVKIFGSGGMGGLEGYGSGFLVSSGGHVVTVWSHLIDSGEVSVVLNDGRRFSAKFVKGDPSRDLAVLKIDSPDVELPFFDLRESAEAAPGTRVLAYSNMFMVATGDEPVSVVHGVISVRTRLSARRGAYRAAYEGPVYVVDSVTNNPGAAGGALTTLDGRLVGMLGRELLNSESNTWVNYAVPMSQLRGTIEDIMAGRALPPPKTPDANQPRFAALDFGLVLVPDVVYRTPAYVETVVPGSVSAKADIHAEDLIVFVNDELVQSNRALKAILGRLEPGDLIHVVVRRKDQLLPLELRVPDRAGKQDR